MEEPVKPIKTKTFKSITFGESLDINAIVLEEAKKSCKQLSEEADDCLRKNSYAYQLSCRGLVSAYMKCLKEFSSEEKVAVHQRNFLKNQGHQRS